MDLNVVFYSALTLLLLYSATTVFVPAEEPLSGCRVSYVYDGDTVALTCGQSTLAARLHGFDTPETKSARCAEERAHGARATERLRELLKQDPVRITDLGREKYGRLLIRLSAGGRDIADTLIAEGLAAPYKGGRRQDWCAELKT